MLLKCMPIEEVYAHIHLERNMRISVDIQNLHLQCKRLSLNFPYTPVFCGLYFPYTPVVHVRVPITVACQKAPVQEWLAKRETKARRSA